VARRLAAYGASVYLHHHVPHDAGHGGIAQIPGPGDDPGSGIPERLPHGRDNVIGTIGAPGPAGIVRYVVVQVETRPVGGQPPGHGMPDTPTPTGPGHQGSTPPQGQGVTTQFFGTGLRKSRHTIIVAGPDE
jgi:hypothetical protein